MMRLAGLVLSMAGAALVATAASNPVYLFTSFRGGGDVCTALAGQQVERQTREGGQPQQEESAQDMENRAPVPDANEPDGTKGK